MNIDVKRIDTLIGSGERLICLEGAPAASLDALSEYGRGNPRAVYYWESGNGLRRLGVPHISIPGTQSLRGVLKHVLNTKHYGVYALKGCGEQLAEPGIVDLLRTLTGPGQPERVMFLLDNAINLPKELRRGGRSRADGSRRRAG